MIYNLLINRDQTAFMIREAAEGLSDIEYDLGVRIRAQAPLKSVLYSIAWDIDYIEQRDTMNDMLCIDTTEKEYQGIKQRTKPIFTEKYHRGPYSPYWHKTK